MNIILRKRKFQNSLIRGQVDEEVVESRVTCNRNHLSGTRKQEYWYHNGPFAE